MDKRKKGVFGPQIGKRCVVFVDDLNMPAKEVYGAQPPLELLRQACDYDGWYGQDNAFRAMVDVQFVAAMSPPGGGRAFVTNRLLRHFNTLACAQVGVPGSLMLLYSTCAKPRCLCKRSWGGPWQHRPCDHRHCRVRFNMGTVILTRYVLVIRMHAAAASQVSDDTLIAIFSTILDWHMTTQNFPDPIKALSTSLVAATLAVYSTAATKLLPTPTKSHYLFNLRDFARVVQVRVLRPCSSQLQRRTC